VEVAVKRFLVALAVSLSACSEGSIEPGGALRVELDKLRVLANEPIQATVVNRGNQEAHLLHCNFRMTFVVQQQQGGSWLDNNGSVCPAIYISGELVLQPGERRSESFTVGSPGEYRLRVDYGAPFLRIVYSQLSKPFVVQ
jgi:hypothetical protein